MDRLPVRTITMLTPYAVGPVNPTKFSQSWFKRGRLDYFDQERIPLATEKVEPERPVAGYFRISQARDEMIAPELYERKIRDYAALRASVSTSRSSRTSALGPGRPSASPERNRRTDRAAP